MLKDRISDLTPDVGTAASRGDRRAGVDLPGAWERTGEYTYRRALDFEDMLGPLPNGILFIEGPSSPEDLVFYDVETTGLGGAGTVAFLVGFGGRSAGRFAVTQFFLADYPGERDFLVDVLGFFESEKYYVSFNGSSFDRHIIGSRCIMNGLRFDFPRHYDLLHISRRLWKSLLESCSLGTLESEVLGITREEDVPGSEVPERYFEYLRTGDPSGLGAVFAHHASDIVSLAHLLRHVEEILRSPAGRFADTFEAGRILHGLGAAGWEEILQTAFTDGDGRAGRYLSLSLKRRGDWERAVALWENMRRRGLEVPFAGLELAKYYEHRLKDHERALAVIQDLAGWFADRSPVSREGGYPGSPGSRSSAAKILESIERRRLRLSSKLVRK